MPSKLDFRRAIVLGWFEYEGTYGFCDYCRINGGSLFGQRGYVLQTPDGTEYRVGGTCAQNLDLRVNGAPLSKDPRDSRLEHLQRTLRASDRTR